MVTTGYIMGNGSPLSAPSSIRAKSKQPSTSFLPRNRWLSSIQDTRSKIASVCIFREFCYILVAQKVSRIFAYLRLLSVYFIFYSQRSQMRIITNKVVKTRLRKKLSKETRQELKERHFIRKQLTISSHFYMAV